MEETEQIDFIARRVDARTSLIRLGAGGPEAFLEEVGKFCLGCLNEAYDSGEYAIEAYFLNRAYDYGDEWEDDEYYRGTEWAEAFSKLFKPSVRYIRSGDISTGYKTDARLLSCLREGTSSDSYLGTDELMDYISADGDEWFAPYYDALFQYHAGTGQAAEESFCCWRDFGDLYA
jgi:hypothetical protein